MTTIHDILDQFRQAAVTEREKGSYFEELIICYLKNEATYRDLYQDVWAYSDWAEKQKLDKRDTGIDLVAQTRGTGEYHAIQCKNYAPDYRLQKKDIDSFFTASGKKPFTHRIIVSTTNNWSEHAEDALQNQQPPVSKITLHDLENSQIDWSKYQPKSAVKFKKKKSPFDHQKRAINAVLEGFKEADRGKMIMACGTGKTFTSLKVAEEIAGRGGRVLFLVPSLSLLSQTLTEWTQESVIPLHSFAVCSDSDVGNKRKKDDDTVQTFTHELRYPATTEPSRLALEMGKRHDDEHMSVVFSTYHSIDVISKAQHDHKLAGFDLIVCDEAHRTTGATFGDDDESAFVRVHDAKYIKGKKRLYMTATPRIYSDVAEAKAEKENAKLYGMNKEEWYGKGLFVITFSEAVKRGLLVDYKVIVLSIEESHVSRRIQNLLKDAHNQLKVDDAAKIIGCWKALSKQDLTENLVGDESAMKKAVAFCQVIELGKEGKTHKVSSKQIARMFQSVVEAYQESDETDKAVQLTCEAEHVDGSMNAGEKEEKLEWLKEETPENICRILSNVRCLSEGVDVPALDAVLFLTPRNSQVDVVQSVGRVMRNAPNKKRGYVILPVVIPAGVEPHEALNDNKTYAVVWQVLQALRSHDDRFDAMVNKLDLIGKDTSKMEVIAITDKISKKQDKSPQDKKREAGKGSHMIGEAVQKPATAEQTELQFEIGEIERAIYAKLVQKVGNRHHWEDWANDIAKIARTHIDRINGILENENNKKERKAFHAFAAELRDDLNDSITDGEIVEMLAQHLITKPVFDALFSDYSFASHNPMSQAMQAVLDVLQEHRLEKEADTLQTFYDSVKMRAANIDDASAKQKIVVELYDKFFRNAFPKMTERLGIVYTPVEVVDFIIHSVNDVLQSEFGQTLGSKGVHILDPFTGTGTFITRLLQSGLIKPEELAYKYKNEIHANEIVLLAYYIAAINIEAVYHGLAGGKYQPFEGICLTDTFQMYEKEDMVDALLVNNSERRKRQKKLDIRVIIGNPPYSVGQTSENDGNKNLTYPSSDERIRSTYAAKSTATNKNSLYDSYIRSIRWASDRVQDKGIVCFVTNGSFIDNNAMDGLRACLKEEFASIYCFNLRGNQRTSGELSRMEGGKIFGSGSRASIAISLFIKDKTKKPADKIFYHDIGDYLTREQKLKIIADLGTVKNIKWQKLEPNSSHDWINQRDPAFDKFIAIGDKEDERAQVIFDTYSSGIKTNRDTWAYNFCEKNLKANMKSMIDFYNHQRDVFEKERKGKSFKSTDERKQIVEKFVDTNPTKISWSRGLKEDLGRFVEHSFSSKSVSKGLYRPYCKQTIYFNKHFNDMIYQMPKIFPENGMDNLAICVTGIGVVKDFSALITNIVPDLCVQGAATAGQCFPLFTYEKNEDSRQSSLLDGVGEYRKKENISDAMLAKFRDVYDKKISKEDIFYYVYGVLHSSEYKARFSSDLKKTLPRIPLAKDFWTFSKAGRALAEWHLNYETIEPFPLKEETKPNDLKPKILYQVDEMRFAKNGKETDKTTILYNSYIILRGIPLEAYEYFVTDKPALEWIMERYAFTTDKDSGITNDPNDWSDDPRYIIDLVKRITRVSLETMKIVNSLPPLEERKE